MYYSKILSLYLIFFSLWQFEMIDNKNAGLSDYLSEISILSGNHPRMNYS